MSNKKISASAMLLFASFIWGTTFVAQSAAMAYVAPFTFLAMRSLLGAIVLLPVVFVFDRINGVNRGVLGNCTGKSKKYLFLGGIAVGIVLFGGASFQQFGLQTTTVANAGFITTLYIVIVPVISVIMKRTKLTWYVIVSVILALTGLYFLTLAGKESHLNVGDIYMLCSALVYSLHIIFVDYLTDRTDGIRLSCMQLAVTALLSGTAMFIFERPDIQSILDCWLPIFYAGVLSSAIAFTFQIIAQKHLNATAASLIMSLEGVFALLGGLIVLSQFPSPTEMIGCGLTFGAFILIQFMPAKSQ